ncbi:peptide-methionine (S)-S-oxide reductase MsrA [Candidatus Kaiserbacteria bacterium]|nr:peptide-methionine (S)-S-oxide reductase MsrA [Candidatus Kaiserbacteria bacterium]
MANGRKIEIAVFGGGCFWCTEAVFKMLDGVVSVAPGYAGGLTGLPQAAPTYEQVSTGLTGHAEVTRIEYDPAKISFRTLLTVFFATHDPTTVNRQGNDVGTQYRSIILYTTPAQKGEAEAFIREVNKSSKEGGRVVTEVKPLAAFYEAESYHKDYFARNPEQAYCNLVISPKIEKVQKEFAELLKHSH